MCQESQALESIYSAERHQLYHPALVTIQELFSTDLTASVKADNFLSKETRKKTNQTNELTNQTKIKQQ